MSSILSLPTNKPLPLNLNEVVSEISTIQKSYLKISSKISLVIKILNEELKKKVTKTTLPKVEEIELQEEKPEHKDFESEVKDLKSQVEGLESELKSISSARDTCAAKVASVAPQLRKQEKHTHTGTTSDGEESSYKKIKLEWNHLELIRFETLTYVSRLHPLLFIAPTLSRLNRILNECLTQHAELILLDSHLDIVSLDVTADQAQAILFVPEHPKKLLIQIDENVKIIKKQIKTIEELITSVAHNISHAINEINVECAFTPEAFFVGKNNSSKALHSLEDLSKDDKTQRQLFLKNIQQMWNQFSFDLIKMKETLTLIDEFNEVKALAAKLYLKYTTMITHLKNDSITLSSPDFEDKKEKFNKIGQLAVKFKEKIAELNTKKIRLKLSTESTKNIIFLGDNQHQCLQTQIKEISDMFSKKVNQQNHLLEYILTKILPELCKNVLGKLSEIDLRLNKTDLKKQSKWISHFA